MTTAAPTTWEGVLIFTPPAVLDFFDACQDSNEMRLVFHWLLARNPYVTHEPSYQQVARDFDRWLKLTRPRERARHA